MHLSKTATLVSRDRSADKGASPMTSIIIASVLGTVALLFVLFISVSIIRRKRLARRHFKEACLRDPTLTREEYERRRQLTFSRLVIDEEAQRNNIIRKSQQSRASETNVGTISRPMRTRSKTWHGRTRRSEDDLEEGRQLVKETYGEWSSAQANVEYTWQLLHGKKYPSPGGGAATWNGYDGETLERPPTVRLKTPPLLSHPMFRCSSGEAAPKHLSLPAELMRVRSDLGQRTGGFGGDVENGK